MKKLFLLSLFAFALGTTQANAQWRNKYKCHNFYGNGITEHLIAQSPKNNPKGSEYLYYTSRNATRIKLIVISTKVKEVGMEGVTIVKTRFPNSKTVYTLEFVPGGLYCIHPNGKRQAYEYIPD
ncbi:MAG TPA: hypothetical protein DCS93_44715 [Microscillaceae bacterium]|nr:hypothetical protein [Microscillaceae bacterium]